MTVVCAVFRWLPGLLLVACGEGSAIDGSASSGDIGPGLASSTITGADEDASTGFAHASSTGIPREMLPTVAPSAMFVRVADPKLQGFTQWPFVFDVEHGSEGARCDVSLVQDDVERATWQTTVSSERCSADWDGRLDGVVVAPGTFNVVANVSVQGGAVAQAQVAIEVVRIGLASVHLTGASQVPLMYGRANNVDYGYIDIGNTQPQWRLAPANKGNVALDDAAGAPVPLPSPWLDLTSPPLDPGTSDGLAPTLNLPSAFAVGEGMEARVVFATMSSAGDGAPHLSEVRLRAPDSAVLETDGLVRAGATATVSWPQPFSTVGRSERSITWRFEARMDEGAWVMMPGDVTTTHIIYTLAGAPNLAGTDVPYRAWVNVVDLVTSWVNHETGDAADVAARIVDGVYHEMSLVYDRESGASAYTTYTGLGWSGAMFDLTAFNSRRYGSTINCSDAASIVATFANMIGADLRYHILTHAWSSGFDLNFIRAIGWDEFDETPFFGGRGAFRYHAVVGPSDGTLYDATLQLDGDGFPTAPPFTPILAMGMDVMAYLVALSSQADQIQVTVNQRVMLQ